MRRLWAFTVSGAIVASFCAGDVWAQTATELLLGDVDGLVYDGVGSVDDVYVDPAWLAVVEPGSGPEDPFDIVAINHNVPFTFEFSLRPHETVTDAALTVGIRAGGDFVETDVIFLEVKGPETYNFAALGWLPVPTTGTTERTLDLSDVLGDNILPDLQDGQLNVLLRDDVGVDYARLNYTTVIPTPSAVLAGLALLGGMTLMRRRLR